MKWAAQFRARVGSFELDVALSGERKPTVLIGPNGSGKTTLLGVLAGALRGNAGKIVVGERTLFDADAGVDLPPPARRVGFVPQGYGLFPHLRVLDNVAFGLSTRGRRRPRGERMERARAALAELGCADLLDRFPAELSGGEQQRVALARALVVDPDLLLLDEPLAAVDAAARRVLRAVLAAKITAGGRPCILATHDVRDLVALDAHVYVLDGGKVVQHGSIADVRGAPANDFTAEFFGLDLSQHAPA